MTYIYLKKDLTFIEDPAAQTLLKAFLEAVYMDEYITQCEEEFGFFRVNGELRDKALSDISALVTTSGAPEWIFELDTLPSVGQGDYVISSKRESYSEVEQDNLVEMIATLTKEIELLHAENEQFQAQYGHTHEGDGTTVDGSAMHFSNNGSSEDSQVKAALILGSISFTLWVLTLTAMLIRRVSGSRASKNLETVETPKTDLPPEMP
jgi:hypothetical protein